MLRFLLTVLTVAGAIALMLGLTFAAVTIARSNPSVHPAFFYATFGVLYTLIVLLVLSRFQT